MKIKDYATSTLTMSLTAIHIVLECLLYNFIRDKIFFSLFQNVDLDNLKSIFQLNHHDDIFLGPLYLVTL